MADRRLSRRIPFRKKVKYGLPNPTFVGSTLNLSVNGIVIKAYIFLPPQSRIMIHIYVEDEIVILDGIVAWVSSTLPGIPSTMGIRFLGCTDDIKLIYLSSYPKFLEENELTPHTSEGVEELGLSSEEGEEEFKSTALEDVLVSFLDGIDFSEDLTKETVGDISEEERVNMLHRINQMDIVQRRKLAILGNREARTILVRDPDRTVALSLLRNQRLTDMEIILIAQSKTVHEEVLRQIATNRKWARIYQVKVSLVNNAKTPFDVALRFIGHLMDRDLQALARNKNVPGVVATTARRIFREKK